MFREFEIKQNETTTIAIDNEEWNNICKNQWLILTYKDSGAMHITEVATGGVL